MESNQFARSGVFVDVSNVYMNGGQKMRFDILRQYAETEGQVQRLNAYLSFDSERARNDREYNDKAMGFIDAIRDIGFHVTIKKVRYYNDPETGRRFGKANADMDMAVDLLLQARYLDHVILVTGDGDFVKPMQAIRDMGCRVEVIGFENVSHLLRENADVFTSGYMIPELLPTNRRDTPWGTPGSTVRGICYYHNEDGYGFLAFLQRPSALSWITDPRNPDSPFKAVFFHDTHLPPEVDPDDLPSRRLVFEFEILETERGLSAEDLRLAGSRPDQQAPPPGDLPQTDRLNYVLGNSDLLQQDS